MSIAGRSAWTAWVVCVAAAAGWAAERESQIGYLYPAGAEQGSKVRIIAAGQYLQRPTDVYVSGQGVRASVVRFMRPLRNLQQEQRWLLTKRMAEVRNKRLAEAGVGKEILKKLDEQMARRWAWLKKQKVKTDNVKLPDHYLLLNLDDKSLPELMHMRHVLFFPRAKQQINRQLAESVLIEITVDRDAASGDRELRLQTGMGLTAPVVFQVGQSPEVRELEPNDRATNPELLRTSILGRLPKVRELIEPIVHDLPVVMNGQIMPGDVDRFHFRAKKGRRLVIEASARRLVPYLADAVPGWFQATLAVYDANDNEVAYRDDYRFKPDPVLFFEVPQDGEYVLEIRDAIYRGRQDFVYRICVGESPFITRAFPLGGREGSRAVAAIDGWNLSQSRLTLDTSPGTDPIRRAAAKNGKRVSNTIPYAVDTLPESQEKEPNDTTAKAESIALPKIINGRIGHTGDVDVFRVKGNAGDTIVAEVYARCLDSPLDSLLRLMDASGKVVAWNDDHVLKEKHLHVDGVGLMTHHTDSYLLARLPETGIYYVQLSDAQHHGGEEFAYRLRIAAPRGDFALRVTPSSLFAPPGGVMPICVYALRKDGFKGEIEVSVKSPAGFEITGGRIPAGRNRMRMTVTAPRKPPLRPVALEVEGRARIDGQTVRRTAVAADNVMQAFLYRHLVPANELMFVARKQKWAAPALKVAGAGPVRIPAGGSARVVIETPWQKAFSDVQLKLNDPPEGLSVDGGVQMVRGGLAFRLKADKDALPAGFRDNLIVEAFRTTATKRRDGKPGPKWTYSMGFFPAIPVEIAKK